MEAKQNLRLLIVFFLCFFSFFCFSFLVWCPLMLDSDTKFVIAVDMVYSPGIHVILLASKRSTISSRTSQSAPGIIYMIASRQFWSTSIQLYLQFCSKQLLSSGGILSHFSIMPTDDISSQCKKKKSPYSSLSYWEVVHLLVYQVTHIPQFPSSLGRKQIKQKRCLNFQEIIHFVCLI